MIINRKQFLLFALPGLLAGCKEEGNNLVSNESEKNMFGGLPEEEFRRVNNTVSGVTNYLASKDVFELRSLDVVDLGEYVNAYAKPNLGFNKEGSITSLTIAVFPTSGGKRLFLVACDPKKLSQEVLNNLNPKEIISSFIDIGSIPGKHGLRVKLKEDQVFNIKSFQVEFDSKSGKYTLVPIPDKYDPFYDLPNDDRDITPDLLDTMEIKNQRVASGSWGVIE